MNKIYLIIILLSINSTVSAYIGPGMGLGDDPLHMLEKLISIIHCPLVIDADALTLLPKLSTVRVFSTPTILTPHMGEMSKLLQDSSFKGPISLDKLKQCQDYVCDKKCILVLKGPFSFIFEPNGKTTVSPYGNPGLATAGSGDVLTGIIAALLSKKMSAIEAAKLGVMIHGIIGEKLADKIGAHSLLSSDMIEAIPSLINSNHIDIDFI